jgi:hypothetical protein
MNLKKTILAAAAIVALLAASATAAVVYGPLANVQIVTNTGVPTNGASGTGAGTAMPGSLLIDTTNFNLYLQGGTQASPTWGVIGVSNQANLVVTNLDAGASGTAGTVDIFPTTASRGKFTLTCTNQTGNTAVTLNANAMGQATTINIPDPGAGAAGYVALSTAALTLAETDALAVTAGSATASKALVLSSGKTIATITAGTITTLTSSTLTAPTINTTSLDAGSSGAAGTIDVFPAVASSGKLSLAAGSNTGNTAVTLTNAAHGQATVYTLPDIGGATGNVVVLAAAQTTAGQLKRADLTAVSRTLVVPLGACRIDAAMKDILPDAANATTLGLPDAAGSLITGSNATGASISETAGLDVALPGDYVSAGTVTVTVRSKVAVAPNVAATIDVVAKEVSDGVLGADICATAAIALTTSYVDHTFTITATDLVAGDVLHLQFTAAVNDTGATNASIATISRITLTYSGK